ncbi:uncharacterized protein LOC124141816 [Haliotis rufescens]|uniref:uncharacterized protein LOC124141816 n=1 Tax=Haliotis rufescens TaxID=6454 RepID=UPI001EAFA83D|nr:uncharacterized protein LOC124141816 [Haliotis rufescens]
MIRCGNKKVRALLSGSLCVSSLYTIQTLLQLNVFHLETFRSNSLVSSPASFIEVVNNSTRTFNGIVRNNSEANVYRWKNNKWERIPGFCSKPEKFLATTLKTSIGKMKMYIHDVAKDIHVSGSIKRTGLWDSPGVYSMVSRLKRQPGMGLIDIGAQLGTFSLVAAMMGRDVVSVDPLVENVLRLCKTVQEGHITSRVTILFSALSAKRKIVTFQRLPNNIGGTHISDVLKPNIDVNMDDDYNKNYVNTVLFDDILPFVNFSKAFIKIDVEGHEYEALKEARKFFANIDVFGILMEWFQIRTNKRGFQVKELMSSLNFRAEDPMLRGRLDQSKPASWPSDILWLKKDAFAARPTI